MSNNINNTIEELINSKREKVSDIQKLEYLLTIKTMCNIYKISEFDDLEHQANNIFNAISSLKPKQQQKYIKACYMITGSSNFKTKYLELLTN
jgi:hypothetical protein